MPVTVSKPLLIVILGIMTAAAPLSIDMYLPAFAAMERSFHTDAGHVQLTLSAFFLAFALGQLVYGPLADRYGRKIVLYAGLLLFTVASLLCAFAVSIDDLIVFRFLQALGACAGVVVARAVVSDLFEAREAAGIYSAMMLVMGAAPMLAPLAGGYLMALFGWDSIFASLALFGGVTLLLVHLFLPETHGADPSRKLSPAAVLGRYGTLVTHRRFMGYSLAGGFATAGMFAYIASSPFVFITRFGIDAAHFGWYFGANAMGFILFGQLNGLLLRYYPPATIVRAALFAQLAASVLLLWQSGGDAHLYGVAAPLFLQIGLLGLLIPNMTALGMAHFRHNAGIASAFMGSMQFLIAGLISMAVSALHSSSPLTLAIALAGCMITCFIAFALTPKAYDPD